MGVNIYFESKEKKEKHILKYFLFWFMFQMNLSKGQLNIVCLFLKMHKIIQFNTLEHKRNKISLF